MGILYKPACAYDENFEFPSYFHILIKVNGLWPTDGDEKSYWFRLRDTLYMVWSWMAIGCTAFIVSAEWVYFFMNMTDVVKAVESSCTTIIGTTIVVRCIHMRHERKRLKMLLGLFAKEIWINRKSHTHIFDRCIRRTKPLYYISFSLWIVLILYTVQPIVSLVTGEQTMESTDKRLPYSMVFPYDHQTFWNYIMTFIMAMIAGLVTVSQYYAMDALWVLFISFVSGQFEILHGEILRLIPECHAEWIRMYQTEDSHGYRNMQKLQDMYNTRLNEIASRHSVLISFCEELEKLASFPLLVNFFTSTFQICCVGIQFLIASDTAFHLYMCNWEGGRISANSPLLLKPEDMELNQLSTKLAVWQYINYYPTDRYFQHKLRFMIMRSHRPVQLTAMHFTVLSVETCSRIISTSMSYFALLKTLLDKQD